MPADVHWYVLSRTHLRAFGGLLALLATGCGAYAGRTIPEALDRDLRASADVLGALDATVPTLLRYRVASPDGDWLHEVVFSENAYAEQRRRTDGAGRYSIGEDARGAWIRVGDESPVVANAAWVTEIRTRRAFFTHRFLTPRAGDEAVRVSHWQSGFEYAYRTPGAGTLTLEFERASHLPVAYDSLDGQQRIVRCDDLGWAPFEGALVLESARCRVGGGAHMGSWESRISLVRAAQIDDVDAIPSFARTAEPLALAPLFDAVIELAIAPDSATSPRIPVLLDDGDALPFLVDSGAFWTTIDEDVARSHGVVPTGEAPIYLDPPWLPSGPVWTGIVSRLVVGGVVQQGARVIVMPNLAAAIGCSGLVGGDFFARAVVDVDMPAGVVRFVPPAQFVRPAGVSSFATRAPSRDAPRIPGEVPGVARGPVILDTGAALGIVVTAQRMGAVHPRRAGTDAQQSFSDTADSADYTSEIDGLRLGRLHFPGMPALGRDRDREAIGGDAIALVGMGVMRHLRVVFDHPHGQVHVSPGDSYHALARAGLVLDDQPRGAGVVRVAPDSPAADAQIDPRDVLVAVDGELTPDARRAAAAIARHRGAAARVRVRRGGRERTVSVAFEPSFEECFPGDPYCPSR